MSTFSPKKSNIFNTFGKHCLSTDTRFSRGRWHSPRVSASLVTDVMVSGRLESRDCSSTRLHKLSRNCTVGFFRHWFKASRTKSGNQA